MKLSMETETLEYKKSTGELREACVSVSSILNKHGVGTLYFGVKNDGTVIGQDISDSTLRDISRIIYESIKPQIYPTINAMEMDGRRVIKVEFQGENRPYSSHGRYYIRVADEDREISPDEMKKFFRESGISEDWEEALTNTPVKHYDRDAYQDFRSRAIQAQRIPNQRMTASGCFQQLGLSNGEYFNEAGNLLFGKAPQLSLKLAVFPTEQKLTFLDQKIEHGNIYHLMRCAERYISSNIHWKSDIVGTERIETPEIPLEVIREVLANSFAHAKYKSDTVHEVCIYPNKVTIYNPGVYASPNTPTEYIKKNLPSVIRNRLMANTLYLSKDIESFGSGFKRIDSFCKDENVKFAFEYLKTGFLIVLYRQTKDEKEKQNVPLNVPQNVPQNVLKQYDETTLNKTERLVKRLIANNPHITREEIAVSISKTVRTAQRTLTSLRAKGHIEKTGGRKAVVWVILK